MKVSLAHRLYSAAVLAVFLFVTHLYSADAVSLNTAYLKLDRMKASTATGGTVCAEPASTATEADATPSETPLPSTNP